VIVAASSYASNTIGGSGVGEGSERAITVPGIRVAVDISERALRFTRFNAHLNGIGGHVVTMRGSVYSALENAGKSCSGRQQP
jgi:hypothetical protein